LSKSKVGEDGGETTATVSEVCVVFGDKGASSSSSSFGSETAILGSRDVILTNFMDEKNEQ